MESNPEQEFEGTEKVSQEDVNKVMNMFNNFSEPKKNKYGTYDKFIWYSKWLDVQEKNGKVDVGWSYRTYVKGANQSKNMCWELAKKMSKESGRKAKYHYRELKNIVQEKVKQAVAQQRLEEADAPDDTK